MEKIANDTISLWQEEGSHLLTQNFEVFRGLVEQAKHYVQHSRYDMAAVYGEIAAFYATCMHSGIFVSNELEQILLTIGQKTISKSFSHNRSTASLKTPKRILHVITSVHSIGGHTRMVWRWIQQDAERSHSIVITRQEPQIEVPTVLRTAAKNTGGNIYVLNEKIGSLISWAKQLRKIANQADLVILHTRNYDVIPIIAFAQKEQCPPILFLDHADHLFWLGASISDIFISLRESGMRLLQERRGIEADRSVLLPIIIEPTQRTLSQVEAKKKLGLPENSILLLSVARAVKYRTIDGISFADAHLPLLKQHDNALLLVVGSGHRKDWEAAIRETQGRIKVIDETTNTALYYQAADIYVDSFPFISNTSLLEAGSYGVPLVSRYPYSDASEILGADMPGLTGNMIRVRNIEEYTIVLSRLVADEEFRLSLGEATRNKIAETHLGNNWQNILEDLYMRAVTLSKSKINRDMNVIDKIFISEPDVLLPIVHGDKDKFNFDLIIQPSMGILPMSLRWFHWKRFRKNYASRYSLSFLLPEWLHIKYLRLKKTLKSSYKL